MSDIKITALTGREIHPLLPKLAELRIEVFSEYPFLYEGSLENEKQHLKKFLTINDAILVVAFDQDKIVGISTGYPFIYEAGNLKETFISVGRDPKNYFCFGESVLQKVYRGKGIGKQFFDQREAHVHHLNRYSSICFYTSLRPVDDPKCPTDYRPLSPFWRNRGFVEHPELHATVAYREIGESKKTPKKIRFWTKDINSCDH
ncbi:MAG: hypothetical protein S4CHLAM123_07590 [Chlamydiales bacterium]|nr:hypothetical protein [Chlamydiales bacterium]